MSFEKIMEPTVAIQMQMYLISLQKGKFSFLNKFKHLLYTICTSFSLDNTVILLLLLYTAANDYDFDTNIQKPEAELI